MQEYIAMWKNYFNFGGKTNVREFWMACLVHHLMFPLLIVLNFIFPFLISVFGLFTVIFPLISFVPFVALTVRRLRDAGYKWTSILFAMIPLAGWIIVLVRLCKPSLDEGIVEAA